jgi:hypothetical protein
MMKTNVLESRDTHRTAGAMFCWKGFERPFDLS